MDLFPAHTDGGGKFSTAPRQGREGFPLLPEPALKVRFLLAKALQKFPHHGRKRGVPFRRLQSGPAVKGVFNRNCDIFHNHIFTFFYRLSKRFEGISHFGLVFVVSEGAKEGHGFEFRLRLKKNPQRTLRLRGKEATNPSTIYCYRRGAEGAEGF